MPKHEPEPEPAASPLEPDGHQIDVDVTAKASPQDELQRVKNESKAAIRAAVDAAIRAGKRQAQAQRDHKY